MVKIVRRVERLVEKLVEKLVVKLVERLVEPIDDSDSEVEEDTDAYLSKDELYFNTLKGNLEMQNIYIDMQESGCPSKNNTGRYLRLALVIAQRNKNFNARNSHYQNKSTLVQAIKKHLDKNPLEYMEFID